MVECECEARILTVSECACFNRYMVECEYFSVVSVSEVVVCFNRYMVECESSTAMLSEFVNCVLIDTWWNVNKLSTRSISRRFGF